MSKAASLCQPTHACLYVCHACVRERGRERELTNGNRASAPCISEKQNNKKRTEKITFFIFLRGNQNETDNRKKQILI